MSSDNNIPFRISDWDLKNEFVANRGPKNKKRSKESHIYGVFASDSEDESNAPSAKSGQSSASKDIRFVSSTDVESDADKASDVSPEKMSAKSRYFPKTKPKIHRGFPIGAGGGGVNIGQWETHTKGIGAKLLGKMGYEPGKGLGKNLQGITTPVEARDRSTFDTGLRRPYEEMDENIGNDVERTNRRLRSENDLKQTQQHTKRAKKIIKTADQIIAESLNKPWNDNEVTNVKIIDMTGPEQRILSSYHEINQNNQMSPAPEDDIDDLSQMASDEIAENSKELKRESIRCNSLKEEIERISESIAEETKVFDVIGKLLSRIESMAKRFNENNITLNELLEEYNQMKGENPLEFDYLKLNDILIPTAFPLLRQILSEWKPFENCNQFHSLFADLKQITSSNEDGIYELILWDIWMPIVRQNILNWPSIRQCDEIIAFLEHWRPLLPDWLFDNLMEQIIIPSLQKETEEWNPLTDTVPIHSWLHPWLPLMADRSLEHIYEPIRYKLSNALTNWHPSDSSAKLILEPWKGVFSRGTMEAFLNINIVPKLELSLQSLIINPHQQCLDVCNWVMSWNEMISTPTMAALLEKNFFPKWLHVLYNWLSKEPDYNEVKEWYVGWKQMFSNSLATYPSIADAFSRALLMMEHSIKSNGQMRPFQNYYSPITSQTQSTAATKAQVTNTSDTELSYREMIEAKARQHGILFMPTQNRQHKGKQVFKFGNSLVYLDNKVVFAYENSKWIPQSLDTLIASNC